MVQGFWAPALKPLCVQENTRAVGEKTMKLRFSLQRHQESHLTPDCFNNAAQCPKVLDWSLTVSPRGVNIWERCACKRGWVTCFSAHATRNINPCVCSLSTSQEVVYVSAKLRLLEHRQQRISEVRAKYQCLKKELEQTKQHLMLEPHKWTTECKWSVKSDIIIIIMLYVAKPIVLASFSTCIVLVSLRLTHSGKLHSCLSGLIFIKSHDFCSSTQPL